MTNITKRNVDASEASEETLLAIVNSLPQLVFVADPNASATYFNHRWFEYTGNHPEDISAESWARVIHPQDMPEIIRTWEEAKASRSPWVREYRVRRKDGVYRWHLGRSVPEFDDKGEIVRWIGTVTDFEDQKQIEHALHEVKESLESKVLERTKELTQAYSFLDSVVENIPNMIFVKDAKDLKFVRFNKAGEELIGVPREQLIGKSDRDFFPPIEAEAFQAKDRDVIASRGTVDIPEEAISTIKKGTRTLHTKKIPVFDSNGVPQYLIGISEDITDQKILEHERVEFIQAQVQKREAEKSAERMKFLAQASALLSSSLDFETTLTNLTKLAVPAIADWCAVDMIQPDRSLKQISVAHKDPKKIKWAWELNKHYPDDPKEPHGAAKVVATGRSAWAPKISNEQVRKAAKDSVHYKLLQEIGLRSYICAPITVRGKIVGALTLVSTDESGRNYSESDLRLAEDLSVRAGFAIENARLYQEAQNLNRVKDEFLATLSHELRTPLNVILGHSEILRAGTAELSPEELKTSINAIYRNAKAQTGLIADLLDVSSIITGKVSYKPVETNPIDTVNNIVDSLKPTADAKGVRLESDVKNAPTAVFADPTRLHQIIWNLASNAIKFTPSGGKVCVKVVHTNHEWQIEVSDTGLGIDPEFLPYVFDRFRQEDATSTRKYGGLGLGLSIVRHFVELHGGRVLAESKGKGSGATFRVTLPLKGVRPEVGPEQKPQSTAPRERVKSIVQLQGVKVLLVEDSEDSRLLVHRMLTRAGAILVEAGSAADAREKLKTYKPDVIVSDIGMPEENGIEFIRSVRSSASDAHDVPAIALTAYVRQEEIDTALSAGFQAHVGKPVSSASLAQAIQQVLTH